MSGATVKLENKNRSNYKAVVEYDGTRYRGWQSQKDTDATIQGKLAAVLSRFAGHPVEVQGSGRTDAGVHAKGQVISFALERNCDRETLLEYLNHYLPEDIGVKSVETAPDRFHARLNARSKTYVYRIWNTSLPNVFERKWMYTIPQPLQTGAMERAASYFMGTHDFAAFCAVKRKKKSTLRTIHRIKVERLGKEIRIWVTGDGFLHHMVRILVGTLVEVGLGKRDSREMPALLEQGIRAEAGITMPAQGLTLWEVFYEEPGL